MADDKNIDNKIRESFEGLNRSAPEGLWEDLSENLDVSKSDSTIDQSVKESFQQIDKSTPDHIWGGVNRQLNIDQVWRRISGAMDRRAAFKRWVRNVAAALLLLLLSWGGYRHFSNQKIPMLAELEENNSTKEENNSTKSENHVDEQQGNTRAQGGFDSGGNDNTEIITGNGHDLFERNTNLEDNAKALAESDLTNGQNNISLKESKTPYHSDNNTTHTSSSDIGEFIPPIDARDDELAGSPIQESHSEMMVLSPLWNSAEGDRNSELAVLPNTGNSSETKFEKRRRFEIGVTYSYNNTWLLNDETNKSFRKTSLVTTTPTYTHSYGLMANYNFNAKNALSTELYISAKAEQDYGVYIEGRYYDKRIELNYSKITLLYQRNILQLRSTVTSQYTVKFGGYLGLLKNRLRFHNQQIVSTSDSYTNIDYGIKLALGQERVIKRFVIGYGINSEYGLQNIFAGDERIPADFNETHTFNLGGYINLRYKF